MRKKIRAVIMVLLAILLAVSVVMMVRSRVESHNQIAATDEAIKLAGVPDLDAIAMPTAAPSPETSAGPSDAPRASAEPSGVSIPSLTPEERENAYIDALGAIRIDALQTVNKDVTGWLVIPGTRVSYPMVRGADNEYYLNHNWKREKNAAGAVFVDSRIDDPLNGFNTIIYGHNMNDGQMFAALKKYKNAEFFEQHPKVYISTGEEVRVYEIFSVREVTVEIYDGSPYTMEFGGDAAKQTFIDDALKNSLIDCGVVPAADDRVITLSTCVAEGKGYKTRWVVQARSAEA